MKMTDLLAMVKDAFEKRNVVVETKAGKSDDGTTRVLVKPKKETEFIICFCAEMMEDNDKLKIYIDRGIDLWQKREKAHRQFLEITGDGSIIWTE